MQLRGARVLLTGATGGLGHAIARDKDEILVAPIELRIGAALGSIAPGLAAAVQRRVGAADIAKAHQGPKE